MTKPRPHLSFWQIWNMSFGFLGIQFGFALQNANVSRIFETLGADIGSIPILWIAAPVTGLIVQPIIGYMSDNTWNKLGRRRPYFLIGAILASLSLLIMPNSPVLWVAAGMLWIMDASINVSMEPFRAFVGDMLPSEQRTRGFAMQSFFIGTGAVIASALPFIMTNWLGIANTAPEGMIPPSVKYSFYAGAVVFLLAVLWTVIRTKEYTPEQLKEFEENEKKDLLSNKIDTETILPAEKFLNNSFKWTAVGLLLTFIVYYARSQAENWHFELEAELYVLTVGITFYGIIQLITGLLVKNEQKKNGLVVVINDLYNMPKTMGQLAIVQFFSWFGLFAMWIYTTAGVTSHIYDMKISQNEFNVLKIEQQRLIEQKDTLKDFKFELFNEEIQKIETRFNKGNTEVAVSVRLLNLFLKEGPSVNNENERAYENYYQIDTKLFERFIFIIKEYNTGADWVGIMFAAYNGFAAAVAFLLVFLAKLTTRKKTHMISLFFGGLGLISVYFFKNPYFLLISMLGVGLAWASILSMPYAMLTGSLPQNKMGTYMGIFNFFIVIPQILAASMLGFFVKTIAGGEAIYALMLGGFSMIVAGIVVNLVDDVDEVNR